MKHIAYAIFNFLMPKQVVHIVTTVSSTHLLQRLLVGDSGALQQPDHILGSLHDGGLNPQPVSQLLHAVLQRGLQVRLISVCTEKIINVIINLICCIATHYHPTRPLLECQHIHPDANYIIFGDSAMTRAVSTIT